MERYHFNIRQARLYTPDHEGEELEASELPRYCAVMVRDIMRGRSTMTNYWDCAFEITDAEGRIVLRLPFEDAAVAPHTMLDLSLA